MKLYFKLFLSLILFLNLNSMVKFKNKTPKTGPESRIMLVSYINKLKKPINIYSINPGESFEVNLKEFRLLKDEGQEEKIYSYIKFAGFNYCEACLFSEKEFHNDKQYILKYKRKKGIILSIKDISDE